MVIDARGSSVLFGLRGLDAHRPELDRGNGRYTWNGGRRQNFCSLRFARSGDYSAGDPPRTRKIHTQIAKRVRRLH